MVQASGCLLLIDFGSTFTKGVAIDLAHGRIAAQAKTASTVETDVRDGLNSLLNELNAQTSAATVERAQILACSSAAGGLRMAVIGLIPELTLEAGRKAAFNAGAKVVGSFGGVLTAAEIEELLSLNLDLILLSGGTDGGNREVIQANCELLAASRLSAPVIYAGNKAVADLCQARLQAAGKSVILTQNVMPGVGKLNIEPARETIRRVFIERIIDAKGIGQAAQQLQLLMPTPNAVLHGVELISRGTQRQEGLGELMVVDVGGATTDVYSVGSGAPTQANIVMRDVLPEPYVKRSVEGDLGMRHNAVSILTLVGEGRLAADAGLESSQAGAVAAYCRSLRPEQIPRDEFEFAVDRALAMSAIRLAVERHVGYLEINYIPGIGETYFQTGKDMTQSRRLIGTGGSVICSPAPERILQAALFDPASPYRLNPKSPALYIDQQYLLYAIGLMAANYPQQALRLAEDNLRQL